MHVENLEYIYNEFISTIEDILNHIEFINKSEKCTSTLGYTFNVRKTERRKFNYRSVIITTYSLLESNFNKMIETYLKELNCIYNNFYRLPEKIKKNHQKKSLEYLDRIKNLKETNDSEITKVINNIARCNLNNDFELNYKAYKKGQANLRKKNINEILCSIEIEGIYEQVVKDENFNALFKEKFNIFEFNNHETEIVFNLIDKLAEERNSIAHNIFITTMLGEESIKDIIFIVKALLSKVFFIMKNNIQKFSVEEKINSGELKEIEKKYVTKFFKKHNSLELKEISGIDLYIGKYLYFKKENIFNKLKIKEIRVYNVTGKHSCVSEIILKNPSTITIGLENEENLSIKETYTFYI